MNFCPNLSNKKIKARFEEMKEALGEDEAYLLWDRNNGNDLESTSDGSTSELYQLNLAANGGNIKESLIDTAKDIIERLRLGITNEEAEREHRLFGLTYNDLVFTNDTLNAVTAMAEAMGVDFRFVEFDRKDALAAANFMQKTIDITSKYEDRAEAWNKLPEEVAHWWYRLLKHDTQLSKDLWEAAQKSDKYKKLIGENYGNYEIESAYIEEAIGQLIAEAIYTKQEIKNLPKNEQPENILYSMNFFEKFWNKILKILALFKKYSGTPFELAAERILNSDMSDLISIDEYYNDVEVFPEDDIDLIKVEDLEFIDRLIKRISTYTKKLKDEIIDALSLEKGPISDRTASQTDTYYESPVGLDSFDLFSKKYKQGIPINQRISIGAKKIELDIYNETLDFIVANVPEYRNKKSIKFDDFCAYLKEILNHRYKLSFAKFSKWNDYRISSTFIDTERTRHSKRGMFINNKRRNIGGSHFGEGEFAFGSIVYFAKDKKSKQDAALIHEILSDVFEQISKLYEQSSDESVNIPSYLADRNMPQYLSNLFQYYEDIKAGNISFPGLTQLSGIKDVLSYVLTTNPPLNIGKSQYYIDSLKQLIAKHQKNLKTIQLRKIHEEVKSRYDDLKRILSQYTDYVPIPYYTERVDEDEYRERFLERFIWNGIIRDMTNSQLEAYAIDHFRSYTSNVLFGPVSQKFGKSTAQRISRVAYMFYTNKRRLHINIISKLKQAISAEYARENRKKSMLLLSKLPEDMLQYIYKLHKNAVYKILEKINDNKSAQQDNIPSEEFVRQYFYPLVHHLIQEIIRKNGKDFKIYFPGYRWTMLLQGSSKTASIYASPVDVERGITTKVGPMYTALSKMKGVKLIHVDNIPGVIGYDPNYDTMVDTELHAEELRPYVNFIRTVPDYTNADPHGTLLLAEAMKNYVDRYGMTADTANLQYVYSQAKAEIESNAYTGGVDGFLLDLSEYKYTQPMLYALKPNSLQQDSSITEDLYSAYEQVQERRDQFLDTVVQTFKSQNPKLQGEALNKALVRVREQSRINYNTQALQQHTRELQVELARKFNLAMSPEGYYQVKVQDGKSLMYEHFINSLQEDTFKQYILHVRKKPKYEQVGAVVNSTSVMNVLYQSLLEGDIATFDKEMVRDYVRMFWTSDAIQAALSTLDTTGNMTSRKLEDKLVDILTTDTYSERINAVESKKNSIHDFIVKLWDSLKDIVNKVLGAKNFTAAEKAQLMTHVQEAFVLSEDLSESKAYQDFYNREDGKYADATLLSEQDKKIFEDIKKGIKVRIKSHTSRKLKNEKFIHELEQRLSVFEKYDEENIDDVFNGIQLFLLKAEEELGKTIRYIDNTLLVNPDYSKWDADTINNIKYDLIGYYQKLLGQVLTLFDDPTSAIAVFDQMRVKNDPNALSLFNVSNDLVKKIDELSRVYHNRVVIPYVKWVLKNYVDNDDTIIDKQKFLSRLYKWVDQDTKYGDLASGEVLVGMASRSKSNLVKVVNKIINDIDREKNRIVLKKGHELMRLYEQVRPIGAQISPVNWQKIFMERDKKGRSTGYWIRELNYGQFYQDKDAYENQLRAEFDLSTDDDGNTIFPDEDYIDPNSVYNRYYDKLDKWLDEHCERRYTLDYYRERRRHLSPNTIRLLDEKQREINLLKLKGMKNGFFYENELSPEELKQLRALVEQKKSLGRHYNFSYDKNGILNIEEKEGDALRIAEEITSWNSFILDKVKYKPNWKKYNDAKLALIDSGATQQEIDAFENNNTSLRITNDFWDLLKKINKTKQPNSRLQELKRRHSEIINYLKNKDGFYSPILNKLGEGTTEASKRVWKELAAIEQEMSDIRKNLAVIADEEIEGVSFEDIANMLPITNADDPSISYLKHIQDMWLPLAMSNQLAADEFHQMFTYIDAKGKVRYLSAFTILSPTLYRLSVQGYGDIQTVESVPVGQFSDLDETSEYVNDKFDIDGQSMQPKRDIYYNKEWDKFKDKSSPLRQFYDKLLETMWEANDMIPQKASSRSYLLPQITGRTMAMFGSNLATGELFSAMGYALKDTFTAQYAEQQGDVTTNMDVSRRPDGSIVNNIPIRFVQRLQNPALQSTDVLGSVMLYYDMAVNFDLKSQKLASLELIEEAIDPSQSAGDRRLPGQYSKVKNIMSLKVYGNETTLTFNDDNNDSEHRDTIQIAKKFKKLTSLAMLGGNFTSITVGYLDALRSLTADAVGRKYITEQDLIYAIVTVIPDFIKGLGNLGEPIPNDKLLACMQFNQLSRSNSEIFGRSDQTRISRFIHQYALMGGYTISDYLVSAIMVKATYHHMKLITLPDGKKQFLSRSLTINLFKKYGYSRKEAINAYNSAKTTLWNAYKLSDGLFTLRDEFKPYVTKKLENMIQGRLEDRTKVYNGVIPTAEKAKLQLNIFGSYISLMRNFMINAYWERFDTEIDYMDDTDEKLNWKSAYKRDDLVGQNLETGETKGALFKDFCRGMYKITMMLKDLLTHHDIRSLTEDQRYAVRRCLAELGLISAIMFGWMIPAVTGAREKDYKDDPFWTINFVDPKKKGEIQNRPLIQINTKNWQKKMLNWARWENALLSTKLFNESITPWSPITPMEIVNNPTVAKSYLEDMGRMWSIGMDLMHPAKLREEVTSGGYQHMSRATRDICKIFAATGIDNIIRDFHTAGVKSKFNFYRGLAPISSILPTQEEWNKQLGLGKHGGKSTGTGKKNGQKSNFSAPVW